MKNPGRMLIIALALILIGSLLAWAVQTNGGQVEVKDIRFMGANGQKMSALLYVPKGVTNENPVPGIVAIHGYINSRETQSGFAIEFARRGYVVLAADQTGHGYSDPPALSNGFGGPDSLRFLRSLDIVDPENVGLEGHSMGGWAVAIAAGVYPEDYKSIVLAGSSTGTYGAPEGTPEFPRNLALVYSKWDEFSQLMWGTPVPGDIGKTEKLQTLFGTDDEVEPGVIYGSIDDGSARAWYQPTTTHPGDRLSPEAIGDAVEWFQKTLDGGNDLPRSNQIWYWKELGTLIAAVGMVLLLFPVGALLLKIPFFAELKGAPAPVKGESGLGWWISALIFAALGPLMLFPFKEIFATQGWQATALFPQNITTQVVIWVVLVGLISLALFLLWHFLINKKRKPTGDNYGLTWDGKLQWGMLGKSFLLALSVGFVDYFTLMLVDYFFKTDYRFWVFAVKLMSPLHLRIALSYFILFAFYFLIAGTILFGQLRKDDLSLGRALGINVALFIVGYAVLIIVQYIPLLTGGTLLIADEPLWSIIAFQFLPLMSIAALVMTFFHRKTGRVYVGGFLAALLITWIVVASQAVHFAF